MKTLIAGFSILALCMVGNTFAVAMSKDGRLRCGGCHRIEFKSIGPAWKDVAAKYAGNKDAQNILIANITKGGSFGWKMGVMPPKGGSAHDDEIERLAKFIAELK